MMAAQTQYYYYEPEHHKSHLVHHNMAMMNMQQYPMYPAVHSVPQMHMFPMQAVPPQAYFNHTRATAQSAASHQFYGHGSSVLSQSPQRATQRTVTKTPQRLGSSAPKPRVVSVDSDVSSQCSSPYLPATPPLSTAGSIGSPRGYDALQTPLNPMFSGLEGIKVDAIENQHSNLEWSNSPPPVYMPVQVAVSPQNRRSTKSPVISCPSLSPSPPPNTRSVSMTPDATFCDPRDLTVGSTGPSHGFTLIPDFAPAPGFVEESGKIAPVPIAPAHFALASYEDSSDVESDDGFTTHLAGVNQPTATVDLRRPRASTGSSVVSLGHASFFSDDLSFGESDGFSSHLPSPPRSSTSSWSDDEYRHHEKRVKTSEATHMAVSFNRAADASTSGSESQSDGQAAAEPKESSTSTSGSGSAATNDATAGTAPESQSEDAPVPGPVNRRGRKQSLTEDPSKTFVCDICHRRFRRQEHLKRHYRSLHTQDKPFQCSDCGKRFSRSDNLAQHARTHGNGAVVMDIMDDCTRRRFDQEDIPPPADYHTVSKIIYHMSPELTVNHNVQVPEDMGDQGRKKRRRAD